MYQIKWHTREENVLSENVVFSLLSEIDSFEEIPSGKICDQDYVRGISHSQSNTYITNGTTLYRHTYYTVAVFIKMRITWV